jgi:transcriptional regulator with XRE-family HTH domain
MAFVKWAGGQSVEVSMKNRIRQYRQRRGMTLKNLADAIGTTPQSVSRLETGNMTLSTDWLVRFASALRVHPTDLLEGSGSRDIELVGQIGGDGQARALREDTLTIDVPAENPVAARLELAHGPYRAGEIVIGNRLEGADMVNAIGHDCLVKTPDGRVLLRRVVAGQAGEDADVYTLVPLEANGGASRVDIRYNQRLVWCARLVMRVAYF